jgi:hypothetical protein
MGFSPFNSEFDAISDNPPGHGVSHHLTIFQALPLSRERSIPILRRIGSKRRFHLAFTKTNPMEPQLWGNIAHLLSLLARAMQTREETIP